MGELLNNYGEGRGNEDILGKQEYFPPFSDIFSWMIQKEEDRDNLEMDPEEIKRKFLQNLEADCLYEDWQKIHLILSLNLEEMEDNSYPEEAPEEYPFEHIDPSDIQLIRGIKDQIKEDILKI